MNLTNLNLSAGWEREQLGDLAGAQAHYQAWTSTGKDNGEGWFRLGVVCLKQSIFETAAEAFRASFQFQFKPAESLNLLGVSQAGLGQPTEAEASFRAAIKLAPRFADAHSNLGRALLVQKKFVEAKDAYQCGLSINPQCIAAWEGLAGLHIQTDRPVAAIEALKSLLKLHPHHVDAMVSLSDLWLRQGQIEQAERGFRIAGELAPQRADVHLGLGVVLTEQKQLELACQQFKQAIRLDPMLAEAYSNLGNAQRELGDYAAAQQSLNHAFQLAPKRVSVLANLGSLSLDRRNNAHAKTYFQQALELDPNYAHALIGMSSIYTLEDNLPAAVKLLRQVVNREPQLVQAQFSLAVLELMLGEWTSGFERYEWRMRLPNVSTRRFQQPVWDGAQAPDKTLLLHCEQGMGDTLHFCRYAALAKQRVGHVVLEAPRVLHSLLQRSPGIDALVTADQAFNDFDCQLPLLSLPRVFETTPENVPACVPYLKAAPVRRAVWQEKLPPSSEFRIGIVWRGNPKYRGDQERSVELTWFSALAGMNDVRLFALQKEQVSEEIARSAREFNVVDLAAELDNDGNAFEDTAAVMQQLDLVISVDSAPAHLAGALGVPVWLLLSHLADWRWLKSREDTPWYPKTRLFRQPAHGDWAPVFKRISLELAQLLKNRQ